MKDHSSLLADDHPCIPPWLHVDEQSRRATLFAPAPALRIAAATYAPASRCCAGHALMRVVTSEGDQRKKTIRLDFVVCELRVLSLPPRAHH